MVAKILVRRLRLYLDDLISPFQSSFISDSRMADNVVLLREAHVVLMNKKGTKGLMILKLDLEQAFNRLEMELHSQLP